MQVAIKINQLGVLYLNDTVPLAAVLEEGGRIEGVQFVQVCAFGRDLFTHS